MNAHAVNQSVKVVMAGDIVSQGDGSIATQSKASPASAASDETPFTYNLRSPVFALYVATTCVHPFKVSGSPNRYPDAGPPMVIRRPPEPPWSPSL